MMQPASQYFHIVRGGFLDWGREDQKFLIRLSYIERPVFESSGYADQEMGGFAGLGTQAWWSKNYSLLVFAGAGQMRGYSKLSDSASGDGGVSRRDFVLAGLSLALELGVQWQHINLAVNHHLFTGFSTREQTSAFVAWPYTFFLLKLGFFV